MGLTPQKVDPTFIVVPQRRPRVLRYVVLLVLAAIAALFFPAPWSVPAHRTITADEWQDNIWPIRPPTPWDISTDFPYPRTLEYDVEEGTWLRLDVHPKSGDIVFDMLGDIYCLTSTEAYGPTSTATARPVLRGIPHDSDAHFSPSGDLLVFRSDAGLGVDNLWVMPWTSCEEMDLRSLPAVASNDEQSFARGVRETAERRVNRLTREGRIQARAVTNETFRPVTDGRFHPSGSKIIATKWYTAERSLGGGEGWQYEVPSLSGEQHDIPAQSGSRVLGRTLPPGWDVQDYNKQQVGPEQLIWSGNDTIIFSKNVRDDSEFSYSKDTHKGIYAIFSYNLTTKRTDTLVDASPGGASRPELSRDGRTLAFVRRFRDYEALVLKDLETGTLRHIWHGLTYDLSNIYAPMGTYPSFAFTPSDSAIIIWSSGQIHQVPLTTNSLGEKDIAGDPRAIKFRAHIEKRIAETRRIDLDLVELESADTQRVTAFRDLRADASGEKVVFDAAGVTVVQTVGKDGITDVPVLYKNSPYYSPSFVPSLNLVLHARWSDTAFTSFELANLEEGTAHEIEGLPMGRYFSPILSDSEGSNRTVAFVKSSGDRLTGSVVATANPGLYIGELEISKSPQIRNLHFVPSEISPLDKLNMRFLDGNTKLLVQQSSRVFIIDLEAKRDLAGLPPHHTLASGKMSTEIVISPSSRSKASIALDNLQGKSESSYKAKSIAFVDFKHVYIAPGSDKEVWSKPQNATKGLVRLSLDGGHDITWSDNGKKLFWLLGPYLHSVEVSKLDKCASAVKRDQDKFGIHCTKTLLDYQEIVVEHSTDISRLKKDAEDSGGMMVIFNATVLTMETGDLNKDLIRDAVVVTRGGLIDSVGSLADIVIPEGVAAIDAHGGFVIPGFIDVHAHWGGGPIPAKSWELETFLAYGVTTLHNPSADTRDTFAERSRLERGHFVGSRIFHTGTIIYGAGEPGYYQDPVDMDEAYSSLVRIKAEGGAATTSYKNYNLPSRAARQRLLLAARNLSMLCVPEGGMNYDWDLTYIVDGMTTVEHAIPVPVLYEDVLKLYAWSGTGSTPTHIVNYGGTMGEELVWATEDVPNDPKLRRFMPHDILEGLTESTARPLTSYALFNTSHSVAKMVEMGLKAHIGAHGEPPYGLNYHAELFFTQQGGLSNYQALEAATRSAAITLGMFSAIGSLSPGKLADFLVYPEDVDLLDGSITESRKLEYVVRGGRMWDASTMDQVWPSKKKKQVIPPLNPDRK
ncbi:hypothetical protein C8J56DRAFT_931144 [Mycena floridula]|nr:hypothetical protein C8J56DRAFT_931144 [Mycena floridula]